MASLVLQVDIYLIWVRSGTYVFVHPFICSLGNLLSILQLHFPDVTSAQGSLWLLLTLHHHLPILLENSYTSFETLFSVPLSQAPAGRAHLSVPCYLCSHCSFPLL